MSIFHPTPVLGCPRIEDAASSGLRPLAAFLDLCLPLDEASSILAHAPAPEPSAGDVLAALDRAIEYEVRRGRLHWSGTRDGDPIYDMPGRLSVDEEIGRLVEKGYEDEARERYGDERVDDWFRSEGWDPDAAREDVA